MDKGLMVAQNFYINAIPIYAYGLHSLEWEQLVIEYHFRGTENRKYFDNNVTALQVCSTVYTCY